MPWTPIAVFDPTNNEDGLPILLNEPRESWKANVFWGLAFGLPSVILPWFTHDAEPMAQRAMFMFGVACMAFMGASAWRHYGRTVRCDMEEVVVTQAFGSHRFPIRDIASMTREDVRQRLRAIDSIGTSHIERARRLDTMPPIVMYVLRDESGKTLLRLDQDMEPGSEMKRFLARVERAIQAVPRDRA